MSMPGFTAEQGLQPSLASYHGGSSYALHDDQLVEPEWFGFIKEAVESVASTFSSAVMSAVTSVQQAIHGVQTSGGPNGTPFVCGQWATGMIACSGNNSTYNEGQMMAACAASNPLMMAACATVTAAMYPAVQAACQDNPGLIGQLPGMICNNT